MPAHFSWDARARAASDSLQLDVVATRWRNAIIKVLTSIERSTVPCNSLELGDQFRDIIALVGIEIVSDDGGAVAVRVTSAARSASLGRTQHGENDALADGCSVQGSR